ncbi:unnamed protein product [Caenorhabditis angaria]|uniref:V-SNARE coiled-coil homology domain-containing protein n=1 Tax=Caenorhabditis angaria TaxID=860376 RepID=A0A9P1IQ85_9PELO|nr:unnamed protein product [Caenorhabditis angaria]
MMKMENESSSTDTISKADAVKNQVDSVKKIMVENVERILERGERLDNIERRTEHLQATSTNFKMNARKVKRKFCMLNAKWTCITIFVILIVFIICLLIILGAAGVFKKK